MEKSRRHAIAKNYVQACRSRDHANRKQRVKNNRLPDHLLVMTMHRPTQESDLPPSIAAEVACSMMLVQHNTFMNDHLTTPVINKYFKDSDAGKAYMCRRTKTAAIVNALETMCLKM